MKNNLIFILSLLFIFASCNKEFKKEFQLLDTKDFSTSIDKKNTILYTLDSGNGVYMQVTNYGGRIVSLWVPDRDGDYEDIVLGFENIDRYLNSEDERSLSSMVEHYAGHRNTLSGVKCQSLLNNKEQAPYADKSLDKVVWSVDKLSKNEIGLSYLSSSIKGGFPGTVQFRMCYSLTPKNELKIVYNAITNEPTLINLSHHGLFNLKGEGNGTITDHILTINADYISPVNNLLKPEGEYLSVAGTPFDFRTPTAIGDRINSEHEQLKKASGYNHNWIVSEKELDTIKHVATLYEPNCGRLMEVWSDQPGLQFYSGNFFNGKVKGKYGKYQKYREAVALETQKIPDDPHHSNLLSNRLNPGETYRHTCIYKFLVK